MPPQMLEHTTSLLVDSLGESRDDRKVKCVLVGDGAIGKTSLIVSYTTNGYPTEYVPTAFDNYSVSVKVDDKPIRLQLCDTAGQDDFDSLRPLCYPGTDVFLLCFSVVSPTSFHNVVDKWLPEIRKHCRKAPVILVGTQSDLRSNVKVLIELANYREQPVNENEAKVLAQQIAAQAYVECSALTQRNLKEVFDTAILAALEANGQLSKLCGNNNNNNNNNNNKTKSKKEKGHSKTAKSATEKAQRLSAASIKKGWKKFCCFL